MIKARLAQRDPRGISLWLWTAQPRIKYLSGQMIAAGAKTITKRPVMRASVNTYQGEGGVATEYVYIEC